MVKLHRAALFFSICFISTSSWACASPTNNKFTAEVGKFAEDKSLQGQVQVSEDSSQFEQLGFRCRKEGSKLLPGSVTEVTPYSLAYQKGLIAGDRILTATADKFGYFFTIERHGRPYKMDLRTVITETPKALESSLRHPILSSDVARDGADAIIQSAYPNCWFEASLAACASTPAGQKAIAESITSNGDNFEVRLPGMQQQVEVVTASDVDNMHLANRSTWANIIECAERHALPDNSFSQKAGSGYPAIQLGLEILTGHHIRSVRADTLSTNQLADVFRNASIAGIPLVVSTKNSSEHHLNSQPLMPDHAYSLAYYDANLQRITLRNPLGVEKDIVDISSQVQLNPKFVEFMEREKQRRAMLEGPLRTPSIDAGNVQRTGGAFVTMDMNACKTYLRYISYPDE